MCLRYFLCMTCISLVACSGIISRTDVTASGASNGDGAHAPGPTPQGTLSHGKDLTLAMVGPSAIDITAFTPGSGGSIHDASSKPYIKQISSTAIYDGITVTGTHLLIQGVNISGTLDIYAALPVVIRGSIIRGAGYWTIFGRSSAGPIYILYSDVGGTDSQPTDVGIIPAGAGSIVYRTHISQIGGDGFSVGATKVKILENYVEKFVEVPGAHHDGLQAAGNNDGMVISRNRFMLNTGETGAINLGPWGGGVPRNVTIDSNYLAGGGYTFYGGGDTQTSVTFSNNILGSDFYINAGYYGPVAYWRTGSGNVWSNNRFSDGRTVNP